MASYADPAVVQMAQSGSPRTGAFLILVAGIVAVLAVGFLYWRASDLTARSATLQTQLVSEQQTISGQAATVAKLNTYNDWAKQLHGLFDPQKDWAATFDQMDSHLYKKMRLTSLGLTDAGALTISGAVPTYTDYARLSTSLNSTFPGEEKPYFGSVKPEPVAKGTGEVQFTFRATIVPAPLAPL